MNSSKQFLSKMTRTIKTTVPNYLMKRNKNQSPSSSSSSVKTGANKKLPEANIISVDLKDVSREGVSLLAKVSVHNPYPLPIPICEITFSLESVGREIASGKIPDPGSLKANDNTFMDVPVKVAYSMVMSLVKDISQDWDVDYVLDLGLVIDVPFIGNIITIPVSYKGEIKLPTLSDFLNNQ